MLGSDKPFEYKYDSRIRHLGEVPLEVSKEEAFHAMSLYGEGSPDPKPLFAVVDGKVIRHCNEIL